MMVKDQRPMLDDKRPMKNEKGLAERFILVYVCCFFLLFGFGLRSIFAQDTAQQVDGFTLEGFNEEGERTWDVTGETADILGDTIKILNVDANAYGKHEVNLKARYGEVNKKSGDVHLQEDVVVTTMDGDQLKTDSLDWLKQNNLVVTADFAEITHKSVKAKGIGFKANPELKMVQLERNVIVEAESQKEDGKLQKIIVTCDGPMEWDQQNNIATLKENVVAIRSDQILKADLVEIHFDSETKKIATIVCTDNVSVRRGDNISYADKAIYSAADQKVIFVGRPKLIMTSEEEGAFF